MFVLGVLGLINSFGKYGKGLKSGKRISYKSLIKSRQQFTYTRAPPFLINYRWLQPTDSKSFQLRALAQHLSIIMKEIISWNKISLKDEIDYL
jgi:hypothetical protein